MALQCTSWESSLDKLDKLVVVSQASSSSQRGLYTGPYFWPPSMHDDSRASNTSSDAGQTAVLGCVVKQLGSNTVSWVRIRDAAILSVGSTIVASDERLMVSEEHDFNRDIHHFNLFIKEAKMRDEGLYECQISTEPKLSRWLRLDIRELQLELRGAGKELIADAGSRVQLHCRLSQQQLGKHVTWVHNEKKVIESEQVRIISTEDASKLILEQVAASMAGNYYCALINKEKNVHSDKVVLHVVNDGAIRAAMSDVTSGTLGLESSLVIFVVVGRVLLVAVIPLLVQQ